MIKQAIVLAAGKSSRFQPYSAFDHKSEVSVLGQSILYWTLDELRSLNIKNIVVVISPENQNIKKLLNGYPHFSGSLTVVEQKQALGMGDAILAAKDQLQDRFLVINSNHFMITDLITQMNKKDSQVVIAGQDTDEPQLYGNVVIKNNQAVSLEEKPKKPFPNSKRIIGSYILTKEFTNFMETFPNEEYLLENSLNKFIQQEVVEVCVYNQKLPSLKYPWHLLDIKNFLFDKIKPQISKQAKIAKTAIIKGLVYIGPGAIIGDYAIIEGPAYVGKDAVVGQHCIVRKGSVLESGAEAQRFADISNSILMSGASIHSGFIGDSIIGKNTQIGAGFVTANKRFDRENVSGYIKDKKIDSGLQSLGVIIGNNSKIGIQSSAMPGVIINNNVVIPPGTIVKKNVV